MPVNAAKSSNHGDSLTIREMSESDLPAVKTFCDRAIGTNYYSLNELRKLFAQSQKGDTVCSFVLENPQKEILGIRITYPAGQWHKGKGQGLKPELWKVPMDSVSYFQSLFIDESLQGQGWGKKLSLASIEALKKTGSKAIVCHAWVESPNDSSRKYLRALGFEKIASHPLYWKDVDYVCTRCGKPCLCTADEMIKYLDAKDTL